jgi:ABC-2 type transport system permease protein
MRRFRASSVPVDAVILAQTAVCFLAMIAATAVLLAAARPVYVYNAPQSLPGVVLGFAVGALGLLALGLLIAAVFPAGGAAQSAGLVLFFPMYMISGAAPPLSVLPGPMQDVADFDPMKYAVLALQDPWFAHGLTASDLAIPAAIAVVCGAGAALLFQRR